MVLDVCYYAAFCILYPRITKHEFNARTKPSSLYALGPNGGQIKVGLRDLR